MQYKSLFQDARRLTPEEKQWEAIKRDFVKAKKLKPLFGLSWPRALAASLLAALLLTVIWFGMAGRSKSSQPSEEDLYTWYSNLGNFSASEINDFDSWLVSLESDEFWSAEK
jgi:hypothetical protein